MGIALSSRGYADAGAMVRDAQAALGRASERGSEKRQVANTEVINRNTDRLRLETELHRALAEQEFRLVYQPIVHLADRSLHGFEALIRGEHPTGGMVPPDKFLPVAEESGLILPIGAWVFGEATAQMRRWRDRVPNGRPVTMAVNLSMAQIIEPGLVDLALDCTRRNDLDPASIKLEVTETALLERPDAAVESLQRLRDAGFVIALDDFGTGYCSLAYLTRFPVDVLKIDREFVSGSEGILTSERGRPLVQAIVDLSASLKLQVVAEGIETAEQAEVLTGMGCRYGQGWHFGRPLNRKAARALIAG